MFAQLIVVDFSRGRRQIDFDRLTGHPRHIIAYCRSQEFDTYIAHLYNYERLDNKALCEVAFLFESPEPPRAQENPTLDATPLDPKLRESVQAIDKLYRKTAKVDLIVVAHHPRTTICGYIPSEGLADIGQSLDWLALPPTQESTDEQPASRKDEQRPPESPAVHSG